MNVPMNKTQELHALTAFIASLPHDSYLRPWLEQELPGVERAMSNDLDPSLYCHGFEDLRKISKQLDERAENLKGVERALRKTERDLADDKQRFASLIERVDAEAQQHTRLTASWKREFPRA